MTRNISIIPDNDIAHEFNKTSIYFEHELLNSMV